MDLHAFTLPLSLGRPMLVTRGVIAFVVGVALSNQPGMSTSKLLLILGVWAVCEGAATVRQGHLPVGIPPRVEVQPMVVMLGGIAVAVGALVVVGLVLDVSAAALTWLLAAWLAVRAVVELLGAVSATSRARLAMGAATIVDLALVAVMVTHTSGSLYDLALFGGALLALWGLLHIALGILAKPVEAPFVPGPRLLDAR